MLLESLTPDGFVHQQAREIEEIRESNERLKWIGETVKVLYKKQGGSRQDPLRN